MEKYSIVKDSVVINIIAYDYDKDNARFQEEKKRHDENVRSHERLLREYESNKETWVSERKAAYDTWRNKFQTPNFKFRPAPTRPEEVRDPIPLYSIGEGMELIPFQDSHKIGRNVNEVEVIDEVVNEIIPQ